MASSYNHKAIEKKWNEYRQQHQSDQTDLADSDNKFYCLDMFPYPSGSGLHVGHWRGYVLSDFYARYYKLQGKNVFHPMGFDSFGLPAENAAIKYKSHPAKFTNEAIPTFSGQLKKIGAVYDWSKTLSTSSQEYYKWTQWLFLQFYKHGLAEKRTSLVNWCPNDQTVLANEQVINGTCERCGATVTKKELSQWYLKTTAFAQELLNDLDTVEWPERVKLLQRNWIGRSEGAEITFLPDSNAGQDQPVVVFTTRPDTSFGVTAVVLAPEHPLAHYFVTDDNQDSYNNYQEQVTAKTNIDRQQAKESEKTAFFTGSYLLHPLTKEKVPVWLADYVLPEYGTGAIMAVPAHDERDYQFAKAHRLPIISVIAPTLVQETEPAKYRPEEPTIKGESVIVFIKHPSEEKYLGLDWKESSWGAKTLLTGTIEDLSPEETVLKEIGEETGYLHTKIVRKLGVIDGLFYHLPKKTNKLVRGHVFLVELLDDDKADVEESEVARHDLRWLTAEQLKGFLTPATHQYALRWLKNDFTVFTEEGALINSGEFDALKSHDAAEKIIATLVQIGLGKPKVSYRLRDWLVSRQRYWGAPIPVVYDPQGKPHPVKDEHLPLVLPTDVDFLPGGESPLARSQEYKELAEKLYGAGWYFDTDTLDTFVDSSWYFLRYLSPDHDKEAFDRSLVAKWLPVDLYIGGIEHATLHLLYARFVTKFLAKYGYIDGSITEPFRQLYSIGSITLHGAKMSKSKGNVVEPDLLIEHYGTDALRGYEFFIGPMNVEAEWNPRGINGIHRFLIKLFQLRQKVDEANNKQLLQRFDSYLQAVNEMIADFHLNTLIAEAMKLTNDLAAESSIPQEVWEKFLITLSPAFPYLTQELWCQCGHTDTIYSQRWPESDSMATNSQVSVLINQKFVTFIELADGETKQAAIALARANQQVEKRLGGKEVKQSIYKPGKVLNLVVD